MPAAVFVAIVLSLPGAGREAVPLVGVVLDAHDGPAAGVAVIASGGRWSGGAPIVLGRAMTDERGGFRILAVEDPATTDHPTVWAFRPGSLVARQPIRDGDAVAPIRLTLGAAGNAAVSVNDPDGHPIAGARVIPRRASGEPWAIPEALGDLVAATTDAEGHAALPGFFAEDLGGVEIVAVGFGRQARAFRVDDGKPSVDSKHVTLRETGTVAGRVVAADPEAVGGLVVRVTTAIGEDADSIVAATEARTDAAGRFELVEIASGKVTVRVIPRDGSADLPMRVGRRDLQPGQRVSVEVRLRRGVRVFGFVREAGGGRPVVGAVLSLLPSGPFDPGPTRTDAEGRYEAFIPPGATTHRIIRVPEPYLAPPPFVVPRPVDVPAGIAGFEMPPITLTRGAEVRGTVVDADGRAASGAKVDATWTYFDGRTRAPRMAATMTYADGSFVVGPVDPTAELRLIATSGSGSAPPVMVRASDPAPARLVMVAAKSNPLSGRVVDADGRPVVGASVRAWFLAGSADASRDTATWSESKTDAEGRFETPRLPLDGREYHAVATAEGFQAGRSRTIRPGRVDEAIFPDLMLYRTTRKVALSGRIVDRAGRPVADVAVWTWGEGTRCARAQTDAAGKYRLANVAAGPGFLFASREGFRFSGRAIDAGPAGTMVEGVVLLGNDDTPTAMTSRPSDPNRLALARETIGPLVQPALERGDMAERVRVLESFAAIDPGNVLAKIEDGTIRDAWLVDHLRGVAARGLLAIDLARSSVAIASIRDPETRMLADLDAFAAIPEADLATRRVWLDRARADADLIRDPAGRIVAITRLVAPWLELGDRDRAAALLVEARPLVETLPGVAQGARARGKFAEALARVEPGDALAMIETVVDPVALDRHRIGIARVLADRGPGQAARMIAKVRDPRAFAAGLPALCLAIAPADSTLGRAWIDRLAASADPCLTPFALGMMALAMSQADRPAATARLREAFDRLDAAPGPDIAARSGSRDRAVIAAALLPVVERVDPALVPEFFWRAVAIRGPRPSAQVEGDAPLIPLLARYDRESALVLFEPLAARVRSGMIADPCSWVAAAAAIDPARAQGLIASLPRSGTDSTRHPRGEACLALANGLLPIAQDEAASLLRFWAGEEQNQ